jgi:predicted kinase
MQFWRNNMATLYLTIGNCASGKTTYAKKFSREKLLCAYIGSDELRGYFGADEHDQTVSGRVFESMKYYTEILLGQGFDVIVDALSYHRKARKDFIKAAKNVDAKVVGLVFNTAFDICVARNEARERKVPLAVLEKVDKNWEQPTEEEGFDIIEYV